uniref:HD domain-containing protein n=1 Tax=Ignisphaera aggregans TaxID=334771 RepID=A0A7C4BBW8_9CREN
MLYKRKNRLFSKAGVKKVYDEVHGYIDLTDVELQIVDTPYFQRLRFIKQLAAAWYVYPGATHTRFSHSLGVAHLMGLIAENFAAQGYIHSHEDVQILRLAALLHDIGHTPFSHAIEPMYRNAVGIGHEEISRLIILNSSIRDILDYFGYDPKTITAIIEGRYKEPLYNQLLSSDIDVDRMDYLIRDALHTGVTYGIIDLHRIVSTLVIDGDGNLAILDKGIDALENFYLARLHMYRAVYYHKTVVGYETLLGRIYEMLCQHYSDTLLPKSVNDIKKLIADGDIALWHDDWLMGYIINLYRNASTQQKLKELIEAFLFRKGYKVLLDMSKFSDHPLDIEEDKDVGYLKTIAKDLERNLSSHELALFIDDIRIVEEDPHVTPKVILGGKQSTMLTNIESSVVLRLPRRYHVKRLYALSKVWEKALDTIQNKVQLDA